MRNSPMIILLVVILFLLVSGGLDCNRNGAQEIDYTDLSSYFPTEVGTMWKWQISLGGVRPIISRCYNFPVTADTLIQLACHQQLPIPESEQTEFALVLRVRRAVQQEIGELSFTGVQLEVLEDELGLYRGKEGGLYWALTSEGGQLQVVEVITCFPDDPVVADILPDRELGQGTATQFLFIAGESGTGFGTGDTKVNVLYVAGWYGPAYQLVRMCHKEGEEKLLYREQLLFRKEEGLVRLIQARGDTLAMRWDLVGFMHG